MSQTPGPNPIAVAWSMFRTQRMRRPDPHGVAGTHHDELRLVLAEVATGGVAALAPRRAQLAGYRDRLAGLDPDDMAPRHALAYWLNLYNAGALDVAAAGFTMGASSVLRVPGGFSRPWVEVAGETLSLDAIEHAKVRRFGDPRIHGALVCGSASCPTLRVEPYEGDELDQQLDDQMRAFLAGGGAIADRAAGTLLLSRVLLWYGADFVRPHRMPAWIPARKKDIARALGPWLPDDVATWIAAADPQVAWQPYDWSLACRVGSPGSAETEDH